MQIYITFYQIDPEEKRMKELIDKIIKDVKELGLDVYTEFSDWNAEINFNTYDNKIVMKIMKKYINEYLVKLKSFGDDSLCMYIQIR